MMARPLAAPAASAPAWPVTSRPTHEGGAYRAIAASFDGASAHLSRGADLSGNADGKEGTVAFWLKLNGGDGSAQDIVGAEGFRFFVTRSGADKIAITGKNTANQTVLNLQTVSSVVAASGWVHVMAAWKLDLAGAQQLYVNGAADLSVVAFADDTIEYTRADWAVGGAPGGTRLLNGCLADLWFARRYLDLSVTANRRQFFDAGGRPVDPGPTGANALGAAPDVLLKGPLPSFAVNKGTGGGFTVNGSLAACATSPGG